MMMIAALALALQAAPAPAAPPPLHPEVDAATQTWSDCTKRVIDATIGTAGTDAELASGAFAGCAAEEAALRAAVAQASGAGAVDRFMATVTEDARITILHYLRRTRQN